MRLEATVVGNIALEDGASQHVKNVNPLAINHLKENSPWALPYPYQNVTLARNRPWLYIKPLRLWGCLLLQQVLVYKYKKFVF